MQLAEIMDAITRMRATRPLILNLTNSVVTNTTANALLALGASPAMSHWRDDAAELAAMAQAVVVNIGTPSPEFADAITATGAVAHQRKTPVVFDPVATGVTMARTTLCAKFLECCPPAVIRGNASEIMALVGESVQSKGVDSSESVEAGVEAAKRLAKKTGSVVSVSGAVDCITDGSRLTRVHGGSEMMPLVTGLGCTATALTGAFLAVCDPFEAAVAAMAVMAAAGGEAAGLAQGPGSLQWQLYDALYNISPAGLENWCRVEEQ